MKRGLLGALEIAGILALLFVAGVGRAGNEVGGGGIAENNILFAYLNLEGFIDLCLHAPGCGLQPGEHEILRKIREALPQEKKTPKPIEFVSERQRPGFFYVEGQVRIAKTGFHVGDTIYVNTDMLYPDAVPMVAGVPAYRRPLDLPIAVSLLVHELGHHQGERDHAKLDLMGSRLQTLMRTNTQEVDGGPSERYLIATAIDYASGADSDLILRDRTRLFSLRDDLRRHLHCPAGGKLAGYVLWNLHWLRPLGDLRPLRARVSLHCDSWTGRNEIAREIEVRIPLTRNQMGFLEWTKAPADIRQIDCEATPGRCP